MQPATDYRDILKQQYALRRERNGSYTLRAYARDLGISASRLSEVLSKDHRLSRPMALKIGQKLRLGRQDLADLCDLADAEHPRSPAIRERAVARLAKRRRHDPERWQLVEDEVEMIASWHHLAILETLSTSASQKNGMTRAQIGARLGLSETEVGISLSRLQRLKLIHASGERVRKAPRDFATTHDIPSEAIKRLHGSLMLRAQSALREQPVAQRAYNSLVLAIPQAKIADARARLHDFCREFAEEMSAESAKDEVYCLAMQFFALTVTATESDGATPGHRA